MIKSIISISIFLFLFTVIFSCNSDETKFPKADVIYYNANVISMTGPEDVHEAIAIKDGKILAVGDWVDIVKYQGEGNVSIDLKSRTIVPGFIDGHSHIMGAMENVGRANLWSPPAGGIENFKGIIEALKVTQKEKEIKIGEWILGYGYDPDLLEEQRHPTRYDLDAAFPENPVFINHVSGHLGVVNSAALEIMGVSRETPNPTGGEYERVAGSQIPNGIIKESARMLVDQNVPSPAKEDIVGQFMQMQAYYASCGITTAQDGFTKADQVITLQRLNDMDSLYMDIVSIVGFIEMDSIFNDPSNLFGVYDKKLKLGGIKLVADGSPQGKTALMNDPYLTEVPGCLHDCRGIAILPESALSALVKKVYSKGIQLYIHCNGDAAIDMFLRAHEAAIDDQKLESKSLRSVIIHSQFMRPDLIDKYVTHGLIPSYFTNHTFFWGDVHVRNMGQERAFFTSPLKSSIEAGITFTNHTDYYITPHNQLFTIWSAVNRVSRSGMVIGPDERVSPYEALKAITINGAYQYGEEASKVTLEVGKLADMVILSHNPMVVDPITLKGIEVLKTIKEGKVIFSNSTYTN